MAGNVENALIEKLKMALFAIQLDEITTVAEEAMLIVQYIEVTSWKKTLCLSISELPHEEKIFSVLLTRTSQGTICSITI